MSDPDHDATGSMHVSPGGPPQGGPTLAVGTQVGPYRVLGSIGSGAMGEVHRARDERLERDVALKVLPGALAADPGRLRRFEQEARASGRLNHPNVVAVYDVGTHEGCPYLVSELLEGETLRARIAAGELPVRKVVGIARQIVEGLAAAHDKGIVHRDLKPDNVFVADDGGVKILDFGLAKLVQTGEVGEAAPKSVGDEDPTHPGTVVGTPGYMSPEQVVGETPDARSDIFSFGVVLAEMLTGVRTFASDSAVETMAAVLREQPRNLAELELRSTPELLRIVVRCLEKRAPERFQSARDLGFALESVSLASETSALPRMGTPRQGTDWRRLARVVAVTGALAGLVLGAVLLGRALRPVEMPSFQPLTFRRGLVSSARFSPDGHTVFYSAAWEGQPQEVFALRLDSVESQSLQLAGATLLATSPGAMAIRLPGGAGPERTGTLAEVSLAGGTPRPLLEDVIGADWDPQSGQLAVLRRVAGACRLELPIGTPLFETGGDGDDPRVSPDGSRIAFINQPLVGDTMGSVVVLERGGRLLARSRQWVNVDGLAWGPGADEVWFTASDKGASRGLYTLDLAGNERRLLRVPGTLTLHDVSAEGRVLLSHSSRRYEAAGLLHGDEVERSLSWLDATLPADLSSDGSRLLFTEGGDGGGPEYSVWLRSGDSSPVRLGEGYAMGLSPDGRWAISIQAAGDTGLVLLPTGTGSPRTPPRGTLANVQWAYWLPDGERILLVGNEEGRPARLFLQSLPDGLPEPLTPEGTRTTPWVDTISPDGRVVPVVAVDGQQPYLLQPLDGTEPLPVQGLEIGEEPVGWSSDGRYLYVRRSREPTAFHIDRLELASSRREPWRRLGPADRAGVSTEFGNVLLSDDGEAYAYCFSRELSELHVVDGLR